MRPSHDHSRRLCAACITERYLELKPAPRARISPTLVAARIRRDRGSVWGAVVAYGVSYRHALAIRAGWRGARRQADAIPYSAGGWTNGRRHGWAASPLTLLEGGRRASRRAVS